VIAPRGDLDPIGEPIVICVQHEVDLTLDPLGADRPLDPLRTDGAFDPLRSNVSSVSLKATWPRGTDEEISDPIIISVLWEVEFVIDVGVGGDLNPIEPAIFISVIKEGDAFASWALNTARAIGSDESLWPSAPLRTCWALKLVGDPILIYVGGPG